MRWLSCLCLTVLLGSGADAQTSALLSSKDAIAASKRVMQLIEVAAVAVPELFRAGAPISENARQALINMESPGAQQHSVFTYNFYTNARAFLTLADSVPKPYPFPAAAAKQFSELRDSVERLDAHFRALLELKERQLRNPDRDNLRRYTEANEKLDPPAADKLRVVFLGDSITDGWRLNEYFVGRDFVNRGISGQITGEMLGRMKADVLNLKPKAVLVLAGTNDIARGVDLKAIENNLEMMADLAVAHNIKPLFASLLPVSDHHKAKDPAYEQTKRRPPERILELNGWIKQFCIRRKFTYVDYFAKVVDSNGFLNAELADDGLHPNAAGYRLMAPVVLEALGRAIGQQQPVAEPPPARTKRFGVF